MRDRNLWYKMVALILVLVLIVPILAACDDDDDDEETTQPAATTTQPAETTASPTPTSTGPVKIGLVSSWTGEGGISGVLANQAIPVIEQYVKEIGGILGGRSIEIVKEDDKSQVSGAVAAFTKLSLDDDIAVIVGSTTPAQLTAMTEEAEDLHVPFLNTGDTPKDLTDYPWTSHAGSPSARNEFSADFIVKVLKPETMMILVMDDAATRSTVEKITGAVVDAIGTDIVDEIRVAPGIADLSAAVTKVKSKEPDVLFAYLTNTNLYPTLFKAIADLGGIGDTKVVQAIGGVGDNLLEMSGAQGSYNYLPWVAGLPFPGAQTYERLFQEATGRMPSPYNFYAYMPLMNAVQLINQAGTTDREELQKYMRSGNVTWDGITGPFTLLPNGENTGTGVMTIIQDGKWVPVVDWE